MEKSNSRSDDINTNLFLKTVECIPRREDLVEKNKEEEKGKDKMAVEDEVESEKERSEDDSDPFELQELIERATDKRKSSRIASREGAKRKEVGQNKKAKAGGGETGWSSEKETEEGWSDIERFGGESY